MVKDIITQGLQVETYKLGELENYRFVVIFARHQEQWLYCQHKERDTWETAGGHIEAGETCLEAAKRELFEETGAVEFDITPVFDYSVRRGEDASCGQVFFAHILRLDPLPQNEMRDVKLFRDIPDAMTYPQILPLLYRKLQEWLDLQK